MNEKKDKENSVDFTANDMEYDLDRYLILLRNYWRFVEEDMMVNMNTKIQPIRFILVFSSDFDLTRMITGIASISLIIDLHTESFAR